MFGVRSRVFGAVLLSASVLVIPNGAAVAAPPGAAASTSCVASWTRQPVSNVGTDGFLDSITGTSPTSLYATGVSHPAPGINYNGRIVRNTGSGWSDVALPDLGPGQVALGTSLSTRPNTAWVGGRTNYNNSLQAVLLHVVASTATLVSLPAPPPGYSEFAGEDGPTLGSAGGSDLWVGAAYYAVDAPGTTGEVYHQSAPGSWTTIPLPSTFVGGIAAVSPSVAYVAAGGLYRISGTTVSSVVLPGNPSVGEVVATSADNIWTLGSTTGEVPVIDHFDGTTWTSIPLPDVATTGTLDDITLAPNGVLWALGYAPSTTPSEDESVLARYDPRSATWAVTPATVGVVAGNTVSGGAQGLLALGNGIVYMAGYQDSSPAIARLCQLPASLSGGATAVTSQTLGDGVLVTSPVTSRGAATVTDTTGLLSTGPLQPGQGAALSGSVAATYNLRTSSGGGKATFGVPPTSYTYHFKTTVLVAAQPAPAGYVYKLQMRTPGSSVWKAVFLSPASNFTAKYLYSVDYPAGNYLLRAQVERLATSTKPAVSSGWSPPVTAVVVAK